MESSAKYYAMGLRLGVLDANDIQSWVDAEISQSDEPPEVFIKLAYSTKDNVQDIYSIISAIEDSADQFDVLRKLLGQVKDVDIENLEFCRQLAEKFYSIWVENDYETPEDLKLIGFLDDDYILASQGTYGTLEGWHNEFKNFVRSFRKNR